MKDLYLDINGVMLTKDGKPANHLLDFLKKATENYNCYWLTTHCKGDAKTAVDYLESRLPDEVMDFIRKIKPTSWNTLKTEAINFDNDFIWLDDYVMESENNILKKHNKISGLIPVNLKNNPEQLLEIMDKMKRW